MSRLLLTLLLVLACAGARAQSYSALARTTTATNTDLIAIETNSAGAAGTKFLRGMTLSNLVNVLASFDNFPASSGGGSVNVGNVLFVTTNGNDNTAIRGRLDKPWREVSNAIIAATLSGDVVSIGPGRWTNYTLMNLNHGVSMIGAGKGITHITNFVDLGTAGASITLGNSSLVKDLTLSAGFDEITVNLNAPIGIGTSIGQATEGFTNAVLDNIEVFGDTDCLYFVSTNVLSLKAYNCQFYGYVGDMLVFGGTNDSRIAFFDCDWNFVVPDAFAGVGDYTPFNIQRGKLFLVRNSITVSNGASHVALRLASSGSYAEIYDVSFRMGLPSDSQVTNSGGTLLVHKPSDIDPYRIGNNGGTVIYGQRNNISPAGGTNLIGGTLSLTNLGTNAILITGPGGNVITGKLSGATMAVDGTLTIPAAGAITTNGNQFGATASGQLSIRTQARLTNVVHEGDLMLTNTGGAGTLKFRTDGSPDASLSLQLPTTWFPTNKIVVMITNPAAGDLLIFRDVTISGGTASILLTNTPLNANQFAGTSPTIKNGALVTNLQARGITDLNLTVSRAAAINASGNLTNSQAVDLTELETLDGVTSSIQTQLNGKQNGQTNANQFGASTTLTLKDGVQLTNAVLSGGTVLNTNATAGASPFIAMTATNGITFVHTVANSNAVSVTNIWGPIEMGITTPLFLNCNFGSEFIITNRVTAATTVVITNSSPGQKIRIIMHGEVAGGTSRVITLVPQLGHLVADLDTFGVALGLNTTFTLTNGNGVEISWAIDRRHTAAAAPTNVVNKVIRQYLD